MLVVGLMHIAFIMLRYVPCICILQYFFFLSWGTVEFSKVSSGSNEIIIWFLSSSIYKMDCMYWFIYIELCLHLWGEPNLIMVDNLFAVFFKKKDLWFLFYVYVCGLKCMDAPYVCRYQRRLKKTHSSLGLEFRQLWTTQ